MTYRFAGVRAIPGLLEWYDTTWTRPCHLSQATCTLTRSCIRIRYLISEIIRSVIVYSTIFFKLLFSEEFSLKRNIQPTCSNRIKIFRHCILSHLVPHFFSPASSTLIFTTVVRTFVILKMRLLYVSCVFVGHEQNRRGLAADISERGHRNGTKFCS